MALTDPLQWVVIAVVAIVFLMYGPKKIPELAKSIGLARKEFSDASKTDAAAASAAATAAAKPVPAAGVTGDSLIDTAKRLGVQTEGKTRDEISNEIIAKVR
ncbi:MAG: twin-arginine translocase TatA/TatE family subunit [Nitrososphaerales archaeon]|jgi:sec-independent protein translocase protein TatA